MSSSYSLLSRDKVRQHRQRLRAQGLRPVHFWVPDVRTEAFRAEAQRQALAVAASLGEAEDHRFVDAVTDWPER